MVKAGQRLRSLVLIGMAASVALNVTACRQKTDPAQPSYRFSSSEFTHSGVTGNCATCHEPVRPENHLDQRAAPADCGGCHLMAEKLEGMNSWLRLKSYGHDPVPASCVRCHAGDRPDTLGPDGKVSVVHGGSAGTDCVACHNPGTPGTRWAETKPAVDHAVLGPSARCMDCHDVQRPKSTRLPVGVDGAPVTVSGHFDPAMTRPQAFATARDCRECHRAGSGFVFDHRAGTGTAPVQSCLLCHETRRPTDPGHPATGECATCHDKNEAGRSWALAAVNHGAFTTATACTTCHLAGANFTNVDSSAVKSLAAVTPVVAASATKASHQMVHSGIAFPAVDCDSCHAVKAGWGGSFKAAMAVPMGQANHALIPAATSCKTCHSTPPTAAIVVKAAALPTAATASARNAAIGTRFIHAGSIGTNDCKGCHSGAPGAATGWSGGSYGHSPAPASCGGCHSPYLGHSAGANPAECRSCHTAAVAGAAFGAVAGSHAPETTACNSCHDTGKAQAAMPAAAAAVGTLAAGLSTAGRKFYHDRSKYIGATDCYACHGNSGMGSTWANGKFLSGHVSMATVAKSACLSCHTKPTKTGTKSHDGIGSLDCAKCHDVPTATKATWPRTYNHSKGKSSGLSRSNNVCKYCH